MSIPISNQETEEFTFGSLHFKHVNRILEKYDGEVNWSMRGRGSKAVLTVTVDGKAAVELRDELIEYCEEYEEFKASRRNR